MAKPEPANAGRGGGEKIRLGYQPVAPAPLRRSPLWVLGALVSFVVVIVASMFGPISVRDEHRGDGSGFGGL